MVRPGEFREGLRQIIVNPDDSTDPPAPVFLHVNGTSKLAEFTLKFTNPLPGNYALRIRGTSTNQYNTFVLDDSTDNAILDAAQFVNGSITVLPVPEPSTLLMAGLAGLGMVVYGFRRHAA